MCTNFVLSGNLAIQSQVLAFLRHPKSIPVLERVGQAGWCIVRAYQQSGLSDPRYHPKLVGPSTSELKATKPPMMEPREEEARSI